ncbi:MAG: META domain-containing protein [Sphingomonas sp.]|uniref:META domain-containing protein n=1 Tax=Sphingomonas sp. TaxID=28214 RepID=UPI0022739689|nr:META domain-containing protein [Sphingomonas sp.]MCX8477165.1 META domain-containing protein [Sphingomonas sp.]
MRRFHFAPPAILAPLLAAACTTLPQPAGGPPLLGTEWRLVAFESSKDAIGTIRPREDEVYTLRLAPDGSAAMQLSCNRGFGSWTSLDAKAERGSLQIKAAGVTMAACPPGAIARLPADFEHIRSFVIADGRLHLNLMLDGGNYVWEPKR